MSRRRKAVKRPIMPDPKFKDLIISKFTSCIMYDGKKSNAEKDFLKQHDIEIKPYLKEPYAYYLESKALIVPSTYGEGLSRVVLEASYIGIPILATKIRGIEEILTNNYKYFIKSTNPFSMSQQLAEMIKDNNYFQKIREKQKTYIKNNFSINKSSIVFIENLFKK